MRKATGPAAPEEQYPPEQLAVHLMGLVKYTKVGRERVMRSRDAGHALPVEAQRQILNDACYLQMFIGRLKEMVSHGAGPSNPHGMKPKSVVPPVLVALPRHLTDLHDGVDERGYDTEEEIDASVLAARMRLASRVLEQLTADLARGATLSVRLRDALSTVADKIEAMTQQLMDAFRSYQLN